jgi:hypothetical protein
MSKSNASETTTPDLVSVRAVYTIREGRESHLPGSVFEAPRQDADRLLKAGAVILATDARPVPIEEVLPVGMDPAIWMADPRSQVNGSRPCCFIKRSDYEAVVRAFR